MGFLHLVLLGFVSIFILGYFVQNHLISVERNVAKKGIWIFVTGVLLNEMILMSQGIAAIRFTDIPYSNKLLLGCAVTIFTGLLLLLQPQYQKRRGV